MSAGRVRLAAWAVPIVSFVLVAALVAQRHMVFVAAVRRTHQIDVDLDQAYAKNDAISRSTKAARFACAPRTPREESVFFMGLRRHAARAGVSIVRLRSQTEPLNDPKAQSGPPPEDGATTQAVTKGVTRVGCQLVLDGSYASLRRFLNGLWKADRLYTMSDVTWSRARNGTELALTLNRYLAHEATSQEAPNP